MDRALVMPSDKTIHPLVDSLVIFKTVFIFAILAMIGLMILSFGIGAFTFFGTAMCSSGRSKLVGEIPFFVIGQPVIANTPMTFSHLFTILWVAYVGLFSAALFEPNASILRLFKRVREKGLGALLGNGITAVAVTFPILASVISLIDFIQERVGIPTGSLPAQDPAVEFTYLTLAPIVEEVGFRVSIIGLIIALWLAAQGGRFKAIKALVFPARYINPSERDGRSVWVLIIAAVIVSAILFGYAHIAASSGWMLGKLSTTTLAGLVLGWVYVKRGLPAAVLLHWAFNYFTGAYYYFDEALNAPLLSSFVEAAIIFTGILTALAFLTGNMQSNSRVDRWEREEDPSQIGQP